jgi:hypothetical protein
MYKSYPVSGFCWFLEEVTLDLRLRLYRDSLLVPWGGNRKAMRVVLLVRCVPRVLMLYEWTRLRRPWRGGVVRVATPLPELVFRARS